MHKDARTTGRWGVGVKKNCKIEGYNGSGSSYPLSTQEHHGGVSIGGDYPVLDEVANNIWLVEGDLVSFYGFAYPTRSVVVRLPQDKLWIWSPIGLTEPLKESIDRLGTVRHLVSPNKIHHLFLTEWQTAYPEANLWGPQSTVTKRQDLDFRAPLADTPPPDWNGAFDQVWFNGSPFMDEIVFFHRASRTVILADLSENFSEDFLQAHWRNWQGRIARIWGIVEGRGYAPLEWRLSFFDRQSTRAARDRVLGWNAERVIMAHGEGQRSDGHRFLEKSFSWMG